MTELSDFLKLDAAAAEILARRNEALDKLQLVCKHESILVYDLIRVCATCGLLEDAVQSDYRKLVNAKIILPLDSKEDAYELAFFKIRNI